MRRFLSALALGLLVVGLAATPAVARAEKVDLAPVAGVPGGGAVIFNNSSGPNNLELTVQLKAVLPSFTYDVYLFVDGAYGAGPVGTITTNGVGNATFHANLSLAPGVHNLGVDVALAVSGADQYLTASIYGPPLPMTFK